MSYVLNPVGVGLIGIGFGNIFLGGYLLHYNWRKDWNWIAGWMFILNGLGLFAYGMQYMAQLAGDYLADTYWFLLMESFMLPVGMLIIWFALIFPHKILDEKRTKIVTTFLLIYTLIFALWLTIEPYSLHQYSIGSMPIIFLYGELLHRIGFVIGTLIWTYLYCTLENGYERNIVALVLIGFIFFPLQVYSIDWLTTIPSEGVLPYHYYLDIPLSIFFIAVSIYLIFYSICRIKKENERVHYLVLFGMTFAIFFGLLPFILMIGTGMSRWEVLRIVNVYFYPSIGYSIVRPLCFTYAILKYNLFGIDIKVKKGTQYLLITLVITLIFLGLEEAFQGVLPYSFFISALIAFLLLLPIHYGVTRLVQKLFPHVTETEAYLERRKHEIFGAALRSAMRDGKVDEKEQTMLLSLVKELQLKPHEYEKLLQEARTDQEIRSTYTILKYDLFPSELRVKSGVRYLIMILILTLIFVVISEAIEGILPFPAFISVVCAFALLVPVNRGVMKVTDKLFPAVKEPERYFDTKRLDIYRAALAGAYADREITEREQASLVALIKDLNITPAEHERVLREIKRGDDPR